MTTRQILTRVRGARSAAPVIMAGVRTANGYGTSGAATLSTPVGQPALAITFLRDCRRATGFRCWSAAVPPPGLLWSPIFPQSVRQGV